MAETTKVRLLRGYIFAGETRQLSADDASGCKELVLQPFWQSDHLSVQMNPHGAFQLQEQFAIINDEKFLHSVERQQLLMEIRPLGGQVHLPLHQFYIAYRDATITNHLCKGKVSMQLSNYILFLNNFLWLKLFGNYNFVLHIRTIPTRNVLLDFLIKKWIA